jgi:protein involved in polysaccharide export with SLBB domain
MPTSAQVTVTTTATIIVPASNFDQTANLHNLGGGAMYLGGANVTTSNGYKFDNGDKLTVTVGDHEALYGITASGTQTVAVLTQIN